MYAKTGEKEEESRPIKRAASESRTDPMDVHKDNEKRVLHRHLIPELNPWTFIKITKRESYTTISAQTLTHGPS
jgi:hypothetical protein